MKFEIPAEVENVAQSLSRAGFSAYLVGGCVRDLLLAQMSESWINADHHADQRGKFIGPKDWDIATDATPEQIQKLFADSVYENNFGTVGVKNDSEDPALKIIEVTTFRLEGSYTDKRHPDEVKFAKTIEEDLGRRDFTVNAMAIVLTTDNRQKTMNKLESKVSSPEFLVDPYGGQSDLQAKLIRAVGEPEKRFIEDALRLMRAVRFMAQLNFAIEEKTAEAVKKHAGLLEFVSKERLRDEFSKLLMTDNAVAGVLKMQDLGLLKYVMPELETGIGIGQNKHHIYTVFEHNVKSLQYAVEQNFPLDLRLSSLLHDVGKPATKKGDGPDCTFYSHQVIGERLVLKMLDRLRFSKELTEKVALLVREHMFVYDPETVTLAGVRRLLSRVGKENVNDLLKLREADRIGSGVPKAQPYRLRYLKAMLEKVQKDPIHPKMLKIKGDAVMEILKIPAGPKIGKILAVLLEEVLDNPKNNTALKLKKRIQELGKLSEQELTALTEQAKKIAEQAQKRIDDDIKKKHFVK